MKSYFYTLMLLFVFGCLPENNSSNANQQETKKEVVPAPVLVSNVMPDKTPHYYPDISSLNNCLESAGINDDGSSVPDWKQKVVAPTVGSLPIDEFVSAEESFSDCMVLGLYENPSNLVLDMYLYDGSDKIRVPPLPGKFGMEQAKAIFAARLKRYETARAAVLTAADPIPFNRGWGAEHGSNGRDMMAVETIGFLLSENKKPEDIGLTNDSIRAAYQKGVKDRYTAWQKGEKLSGGNSPHEYWLCIEVDAHDKNIHEFDFLGMSIKDFPSDHGLSDDQVKSLKCDGRGNSLAVAPTSNPASTLP